MQPSQYTYHIVRVHKFGAFWICKPEIKKFLFDNTKNSHAHLKKTHRMSGEVKPGDETLMRPLIETPDDLLVVAAGGRAGSFSAYVPGWGSRRSSQAITKEVKR